jgi:periplasmic mercuric ion binding protein
MNKPSVFAFALMFLMSSTVKAVTQSVKLEIQNMTCPVCPLTVKKALKKVGGVQQVEIDYETKTATVLFDDAITTTEKLTEATANAGYPATVKKP